MRTRSLLAVAGLAACASWMTVLAACASDETAAPADPDAGTIDAADAAPEAALDAEDPRPCRDCAYFTEKCAPDVLCPHAAVDGRARVNVIRGRSESDVWAAGSKGTILHFDGTAWSKSDPGTDETMHSLWLRDSAEVSFVTLGSIYTRGLATPDAGAPSPGGWTVHGVPPAPPDFSLSLQLEASWAAPGADWLWCATAYGGSLFDPPGVSGLWRLRVVPSTQTLELQDAIPPGSCEEMPCSVTTSVHGSSANDVWAVGLQGGTFHITGAASDTPTITAFNSQTQSSLYGVWAASENEAWLVGGSGVIRRYSGQSHSWDIVPDVPTITTLRGIWGTSTSDIWAVGDAAVVLHFDGKTWSRVTIAGLGDRRPDLYTVWTPGPGRAWIGGDGVILSVGGQR